MKRHVWLAAAFCLATTIFAQDTKNVLEHAQKAIGSIQSVQFSGTGHERVLRAGADGG